MEDRSEGQKSESAVMLLTKKRLRPVEAVITIPNGRMDRFSTPTRSQRALP